MGQHDWFSAHYGAEKLTEALKCIDLGNNFKNIFYEKVKFYINLFTIVYIFFT